MQTPSQISGEDELPAQVRIAYMGSFLSNLEADRYREEFYAGFQDDLDAGYLVIIEDSIRFINMHWVVRIMAENAQITMELE